MTSFEKFFLVSDKIVFHNCGHREDIEEYHNLKTLDVVSNYILRKESNTYVQFLKRHSNVRIYRILSDKRIKHEFFSERALHKLLFLHEI